MSKLHLRLLILLVLLATAMAVVWTTAGANPYPGKDPGRSYSYSRSSHPVAGPAIGEPDVGQTPGAPKTLNAGPSPAPRPLPGRDRLPRFWFNWAGRIWAAHHLGIRF